MKVCGDDAWVELTVSTLGPEKTPAEEDLRLDVTVSAHGYGAGDQVWILAAAWHSFVSELRKLELTRRGSVVLESASPGDLRLEIYSTDHAGHMAVRGRLSQHHVSGFLLGLDFGFAFDPGLLQTVLQEAATLV